jgi:hypothetical protein
MQFVCKLPMIRQPRSQDRLEGPGTLGSLHAQAWFTYELAELARAAAELAHLTEGQARLAMFYARPSAKKRARAGGT